jgi:hypothetical protein
MHMKNWACSRCGLKGENRTFADGTVVKLCGAHVLESCHACGAAMGVGSMAVAVDHRSTGVHGLCKGCSKALVFSSDERWKNCMFGGLRMTPIGLPHVVATNMEDVVEAVLSGREVLGEVENAGWVVSKVARQNGRNSNSQLVSIDFSAPEPTNFELPEELVIPKDHYEKMDKLFQDLSRSGDLHVTAVQGGKTIVWDTLAVVADEFASCGGPVLADGE